MDYAGSNNQQWQIVDVGEGYYKIVNRTNGMVLDGGIGASYVVQNNYSGSEDQQWKLVDLGYGYYNIENRNNGLVIDSGGNSPQGSKIRR